MKCHSCNIEESYSTNSSLKLCETCYSYDSNKLITKSNAKRNYILNDKNIADLKFIVKRSSSSYRNDSTLYLIKDIKRVAKKKHKTLKAIREKIKKRDERRIELREKRENDKLIRKKELKSYFKEIGLSGIRSDSILCQNYIEKGEKAGFTKEEIGSIMQEMAFYYNKTDYQNILYNLRKEERKYYGYYDEDELRDSAKVQALRRYVKKNNSNIHQLLDDIPISLLEYAKIYSNELYKNKNKNKNHT